MAAVFKQTWIPLLIAVVLALGGVVVHRIHGFFGADNEITRPGAGLADDPVPFDPKVVKYDIFGMDGALATINYLDLDATPQKVSNAPLPWSITLTTTAPSASANIVAQGDGERIGCRITVNSVVKAEKTADGVNAQTFCLVKSA